jgi:hypothetical protein
MDSEQLSFFADNGKNNKPPKKEKIKTVISVSRRTDIPAFYYKWLQDALKRQEIEIANPMFPAKKYIVDLRPEKVHSIVLWSKDFSNVAKDPGLLTYYNLYFQYTINNYSRLLEPNVPEYNSSIKTLELLLKKYKPEQFNIRFDPIIISSQCEPMPAPQDPIKERLNIFKQLCGDIKSLGLDRCKVTTSYISFYGHVLQRMRQSGIEMLYMDQAEQMEFFEDMADIADKYNIKLYSCASPLIEKVKGISRGHCIDGKLLISLFGGSVSLQKDKGQRADCCCTLSKDIGSYSNGVSAKECLHGCRYCYVR